MGQFFFKCASSAIFFHRSFFTDLAKLEERWSDCGLAVIGVHRYDRFLTISSTSTQCSRKVSTFFFQCEV